ncbi:MAG: 5-carboxymethyl-2-hydroxymuconate isomerase [Desulfobacteraceae bacterium]|nr:MAG: 5-carboxymethyl-2-hydroxymuconate isomerase [Desulfobacteraceae bacterium]
MHIIRFKGKDQRTYTGCDYEDGSASVIEGDLFSDYVNTGRRVDVDALLPPLLPRAIFCIGLNYRAHADETGMPYPENPVVFMKNPASVTGTEQEIILPSSCIDPPQVDYEAELAVVIGKKVKNASREDALASVFGYTCANDVSARVWQKKGGGGQWVKGKSFDTFCPIGPWIVTSDEISDPQALDIQCRLNGTLMQTSNTSDMIFSVAELISFLSLSTTLLPGTIILTGTPSGVGFARKPPLFLKASDVVEIGLEGIGTLKNTVVDED